jgi:hypothetical protein
VSETLALNAADLLRRRCKCFYLSEGVIYLDGNSPRPVATAALAETLVKRTWQEPRFAVRAAGT